MSSELQAYRYPGSRPFQDTPHDRRLFFGRDQEAHQLLHLTLAEKLVVVFAVSGLGKSSLINAALLQPLRERDFFPIVGRINDPANGPLPSLYKDIAAAIEREAIEVLTLPQGYLETRFGLVLRGQAMPAAKLAEICLAKEVPLWLFFKELEFWRRDVLQEPVLIVDQFEELFTLHGEIGRDQMIAELSCLVRDSLPRSALDALSDSRGEAPRPSFDTADLKGPRLKVVLSLREDWLGSLEALSAKIPNILSTRFRLEPLRCKRAREAIERPARLDDVDGETFTFAPDVVEAILDFLAHRHGGPTNEIVPSQLQLICHYLEELVAQPDHGPQITLADLGGSRENAPKELNRILERYYDNRTARIARGRRLRAIRNLCERGLIVAGRRVSSDADVLIQRYGARELDLLRLVDAHLLRSVPRLDSLYYELSHDTLVQPILASRRRRKRQLRLTVAYALTVVLLIAVTLGSGVFLEHYEAQQLDLQLSQLKEQGEAWPPEEFLAQALGLTHRCGCMGPSPADGTARTAASRLAERSTREETVAAETADERCRELGSILKRAFDGVREIAPHDDGATAGNEMSVDPRHVVVRAPGGTRIATADTQYLRVQGPGTLAQDISIPIAKLALIASSTDGRRMVTAAEDGTLRLWEIDASGTDVEPVTPPWKAHPEGVFAMTFGTQAVSRQLLTSGREGGLRLWDLDQIEETHQVHRVAEHAEPNEPPIPSITAAVHDSTVSELLINTIDWLDDRLAIGCKDGSVRFWNGSEWRTFDGHALGVRVVAFDPSGRWLASADDDGAVRLWSLAPDAESHPGPFLSEHEETEIRTLAWHPDTDTWALVTGSSDHSLRLWTFAVVEDRVVAKNTLLGHHDGAILSLAFRDGGLLASGGRDGAVRLWDPQPGGSELGRLEGYKRFVTSLDFTDTGRLISGSFGGTIGIWSGLDGRTNAAVAKSPLSPPSFHGEISHHELTAVAASVDGAWLASGSSDGTLRLRRFDGAEQVYKRRMVPARGSWGRFEALGFDPDHQRLASVTSDRCLRLWSYEGDIILDFSFHRDGDPVAPITRITFPGVDILSTSDGKSERWWDISDVSPSDSGNGQGVLGDPASSPPDSELRRLFQASCRRLASLRDSERFREVAKKLNKVLRRACDDATSEKSADTGP